MLGFLFAMLCVSNGWFHNPYFLTCVALPPPFDLPHLDNQWYGHGAFFGASGLLLNDEKWSRVLQILMPEVYNVVASKLAGGAGSKDLVLKFENNPVAAAFGLLKTQEMDHQKVRSFSFHSDF